MCGKEGELRERDIQGLKYLKTLLPLLERLHDVGCKRDKARNRKLTTIRIACWFCCFCSTRWSARCGRCNRQNRRGNILLCLNGSMSPSAIKAAEDAGVEAVEDLRRPPRRLLFFRGGVAVH